jgi:hypothetical protein
VKSHEEKCRRSNASKMAGAMCGALTDEKSMH